MNRQPVTVWLLLVILPLCALLSTGVLHEALMIASLWGGLLMAALPFIGATLACTVVLVARSMPSVRDVAIDLTRQKLNHWVALPALIGGFLFVAIGLPLVTAAIVVALVATLISRGLIESYAAELKARQLLSDQKGKRMPPMTSEEHDQVIDRLNKVNAARSENTHLFRDGPLIVIDGRNSFIDPTMIGDGAIREDLGDIHTDQDIPPRSYSLHAQLFGRSTRSAVNNHPYAEEIPMIEGKIGIPVPGLVPLATSSAEPKQEECKGCGNC